MQLDAVGRCGIGYGLAGAALIDVGVTGHILDFGGKTAGTNQLAFWYA